MNMQAIVRNKDDSVTKYEVTDVTSLEHARSVLSEASPGNKVILLALKGGKKE